MIWICTQCLQTFAQNVGDSHPTHSIDCDSEWGCNSRCPVQCGPIIEQHE